MDYWIAGSSHSKFRMPWRPCSKPTLAAANSSTLNSCGRLSDAIRRSTSTTTMQTCAQSWTYRLPRTSLPAPDDTSFSTAACRKPRYTGGETRSILSFATCKSEIVSWSGGTASLSPGTDTYAVRRSHSQGCSSVTVEARCCLASTSCSTLDSRSSRRMRPFRSWRPSLTTSFVVVGPRKAWNCLLMAPWMTFERSCCGSLRRRETVFKSTGDLREFHLYLSCRIITLE